jgi:hypothetical protein
MKATIKIDMDNAAFDAPDAELARILRELADKLETMKLVGVTPLRDINGNRVGELKVTGGRD